VGKNNLKVFEYLLYASKILKATVLEGGGLIKIGKKYNMIVTQKVRKIVMYNAIQFSIGGMVHCA
jgi:hypothetical protein